MENLFLCLKTCVTTNGRTKKKKKKYTYFENEIRMADGLTPANNSYNISNNKSDNLFSHQKKNNERKITSVLDGLKMDLFVFFGKQ